MKKIHQDRLTHSVPQSLKDVAIATVISFFVFLGSFFFMTAALYLFVDTSLPF